MILSNCLPFGREDAYGSRAFTPWMILTLTGFGTESLPAFLFLSCLLDKLVTCIIFFSVEGRDEYFSLEASRVSYAVAVRDKEPPAVAGWEDRCRAKSYEKVKSASPSVSTEAREGGPAATKATSSLSDSATAPAGCRGGTGGASPERLMRTPEVSRMLESASLR